MTDTEAPTLPARVAEHYSHGTDRPLGGYLRSMGVYAGLVGVVAGSQALRDSELPELIPTRDVVLLTVATQRLARSLAKDAVTSPLRAPFTRYEGPGGPSELHEEVTATGWKHAVGELLSCPFCLAQWMATLLVGGYLAAPRATRVVAVALTCVSGADALQLLYARLQKLAEG